MFQKIFFNKLAVDQIQSYTKRNPHKKKVFTILGNDMDVIFMKEKNSLVYITYYNFLSIQFQCYQL